ncbi:MAG TPA: hypothetical protein VHD55_01020 [Candidatus Paceibacterota bacterium]|nr:hypothetical protein [Candidatus Paceibacterota bacterium]
MSFPVDIVNLILYCVQQLGVMLGVGAETVILIVYFLSLRDGRIEPKEEQFGRAVHKVLKWGLLLVIASGFLITAIHLFFGQLAIILQPAFLLKWLLIGAVWGMEVARRRQVFANYLWEGISGMNWYALFALHILAPIATWGDLLVLYAIWAAGFMACYVSFVHGIGIPVPGYARPHPRPDATAPAQKKFVPPPAPKPVFKPQPKPVPKPVIKFAPPPHISKPTPPPAPKPAPLPPPMAQPKPAPPPLPERKPQLDLPAPGPMPPPPMVIHAEAVLPATVAKAPVKPPMPIPQKPKMAVPPMPHKPQNQIPIPKKPDASGAPHHFGLPAIRVMPKSQEDVDNQNRATAVQLSEVKI